MENPIVIAASVLAAAIVFFALSQRYTMMSATDGGAYRLDRLTGVVRYYEFEKWFPIKRYLPPMSKLDQSKLNMQKRLNNGSQILISHR